jgi:ABC-type transporter Mla MlaB component
MRDLEILGAELQAVEESMGQPSWAYLDPFTDRLSRIGVSNQKVENFKAWRQTLSGLAGSNSRDEDHLAKIAGAEKAGLSLLAELIEYLRTRNRQTSQSNAQIKALAA